MLVELTSLTAIGRALSAARALCARIGRGNADDDEAMTPPPPPGILQTNTRVCKNIKHPPAVRLKLRSADDAGNSTHTSGKTRFLCEIIPSRPPETHRYNRINPSLIGDDDTHSRIAPPLIGDDDIHGQITPSTPVDGDIHAETSPSKPFIGDIHGKTSPSKPLDGGIQRTNQPVPRAGRLYPHIKEAST
ncbi:hypothetical protein R80B4_01858 [Fibrobacteres bacterium R8-0-B4]